MNAPAGRSIGFNRRAAAWLVGGVLLMLTTACAPQLQKFDGIDQTPSLTPKMADQLGGGVLVSSDGTRLPLRVWAAEGSPKAVIVALHGFNDYRNAFDMPGRWWAAHGVTTYAYDQRGFGATAHPGVWAREEALIADVHAAVVAVHARHPGVPLFLLGESMGSAVIMSAVAELDGKLNVNGLILSAPAVWGWSTLNPFYKSMLWLSAHTVPWKKVTGEGVEVTPSDNREMLIALGRDHLVIKATRIDAIYGLVNLMERAARAAPALRVPMLVLHGAGDDIIPPRAFAAMLRTLKGPRRVVQYRHGYHMLLRDLQAETVWRDVLAWIDDRGAPLPSGEEQIENP